MPVDSPPVSPSPLILESLPTPDLPADECPRRARMQIDLMLLAIEALDLGGGEAMLSTARELALDQQVKGRVQSVASAQHQPHAPLQPAAAHGFRRSQGSW